jgi:LL-diaminopimelate aminotransferase
MLRRFDTIFDPATELLPLIGSKEGLAHLVFAVCNPGDVVVVPEPGYQAYIGGTVLAGAVPHVVPLRAEQGFLLELDELPPEVLAKTRLVFLNYPNNPTAAVAPRDYLERTIATCRRHGIVLAYDNAYVDVTFDGYVAPSIFEIEGARDVAIEFFSMSKSFQMTGWRLGFAAGNATLIGALSKVKSYVDTGVFLALQRAGAWTLDHAEELIAPVVAELHGAARCGGRGAARGRVCRRGTARGHVSLGPPAGGRRLGRLRDARLGGGRGRRAARERLWSRR